MTGHDEPDSVGQFIWNLHSDTINITENPIYIITTDASISYGDSILLGGSYQTLSGTYYDSLNTINGCDSTVTTTLTCILSYDIGNDTIICEGDNFILDAGSGFVSYIWNDSSTSQLLSVDTTGTFHITVTDTNGCIGYDTINITVNALPTTPEVENVEIVYGDTIPVLTATGNNINWYNNSNLDTLLHSGTTYQPNVSEIGIYTYYITDEQNGCLSDVDTAILVIKNQLVTGISVSGNDITVNGDTSVMLALILPHNATDKSITWSIDAGTTDATIDSVTGVVTASGKDGGDGAVTVTATANDESGVFGDTTIQILNQSTITFISNSFDNNKVFIYPNPTNGIINIEIENIEKDEISIIITNLTSHIIYKKHFSNASKIFEQIDFSGKSQGIYYLKIIGNSFTKVEKVVVR